LANLDSKGGDGLWLVEEFRQIFPELPIIAISGVPGA
jgi:hypothetical protein